MCFDVSIPIRLICSTDGLLCLRSATASFWHTRCRRGPSTPTEGGFRAIFLNRCYGASGEAGAFQPVEDRHGQGRSGPPGSECCVIVGDGNCEAYTAIRWGVRLSLEIDNVAEAEPVISVEGNMCGTVMRGAVAPPGSNATSRRKGMRRNLRDLTLDHRHKRRLARIGKARSRSR